MTIAELPIPAHLRENAEPVATLADALVALGGISPARIRYCPFPGTEADVVGIQAKEGRLFELVDKFLVEKPMGLWESVLAGAILATLREFVVPRKLGIVAGEAGMYRLFPDLKLIRMPDVGYVSHERLVAADAWGKPVPQLAPDLAVEVLSEGNTVAEMERKRREYFAAGVRLVWMVDFVARTIDVYTSDSNPVTLHEGQTLDGGVVLPGFALELATLFAEIKR